MLWHCSNTLNNVQLFTQSYKTYGMSRLEPEMATVLRKLSDLSGAEAADDAFVTIVVRKDPRIELPVQLDALAAEVSGLNAAKDLCVLQIKLQGGQSYEVVCTKADFDKLAQGDRKMDEILSQAKGTKGRPVGSRNGTHNGQAKS